jgi:hypothetical protein
MVIVLTHAPLQQIQIVKMIRQELVKYFKTYLDQGYAEEQLKATLVSQGYALQDLEDSLQAMKILTKPIPGQKQAQPTQQQTQVQQPIQTTTQQVATQPQQQTATQPQQQTATQTNPNEKKPEANQKKSNSSGSNSSKILIVVALIVVLGGLIGAAFFVMNLPDNGLTDNTNDIDTGSELAGQEEPEQITEEEPEQQLNCGDCQYADEDAGECIDYACCADIDCNDNNESTTDSCSAPKTLLSECKYEDVLPELNDTQIQEIIDNATTETPVNVYTPQNCTSNETCDDSNPATADTCDLNRKICTHKIIKECVDNDGFCPVGCKLEDDNDCESVPDGKCIEDNDCNDDNNATSDSCLKQFGETYGICDFANIQNCIDDDSFCPMGCWNNEDNDCSPDNLCADDNDCDDDNSTTTDTCEGEPRVCVYELITSCTNDDNFCPVSCTSSNDNDCNQTQAQDDPDKDSCGEDVFCYKDKMVETNDYRNCDQILWYWNDPQDYFVSQCIYEIALQASNSGLCNEITNSGIQTQM